MGQKNYAEAEPLLLQSYQGLQQRQASLPPILNAPRRITESLERLVQLNEAWGKPTQATEWKKNWPSSSKPPTPTQRKSRSHEPDPRPVPKRQRTGAVQDLADFAAAPANAKRLGVR